MRVVIFSWRDISNPRAGGAERMTLEHARRWVDAGHSVTLFTSRYPGASEDCQIAGIRVVRRGTERTVHLCAQHWYRRLPSLPDLVIDEVHGLPFCSAAYAGVPVLAWIYEVARDIWFRMYPLPVSIVGRLLEGLTLGWYARKRLPFMTDSSSTAADLVAIGVPRHRVTVIEPGINVVPLVSLPRKESVPTLIFVGRLVRMKGVADALYACARVRVQLGTCRLWVIGQGEADYIEELRRLTLRLGLQENVELLGWLPEEEKYRRLARAHVLIHPSQREGWGINVIEANAMGTPAIGYSVPGLRDSIVQGTTGVLCRRGHPEELAEAVSSLITTPERYRSMQLAALARSRQYTWESAALRSMSLLACLVG